MKVSQQAPSGTALQEEVFNLIPGMVNQCRGAAQYNSQDQAFSFQKQVRFKQGSSPDLSSNASSGPAPQSQSSTPHQLPQPNQTFDVQYCFILVSKMPPPLPQKFQLLQLHRLQGVPVHVGTQNHQIKGGYSSDAKLVF